MVVLPGRRSKVLPAIGRPCRGRGIPRGADAPLGPCPRLGAPAPRRLTHGATRAVLLLLAAGRGSEQGRRWAAPVDARHAGRVPALPPPAWARSSVAPPARRGEAGCPGRRSRDDGGLRLRQGSGTQGRRPVRSARLLVFVFGGARVFSSRDSAAQFHLLKQQAFLR